MAASTQTSTHSGTKLSISATLPASVSASAYGVPVYTEIKEVTDAGAVGRTYNTVEHMPLSSRGVQERKGSYRDGTPQVQAAYVPGDPGQVIVFAAVNSDNYYSFKEELQNGSIIYYQALVLSAPVNGGSLDSMVGITVNLTIKPGSILIVHPA